MVYLAAAHYSGSVPEGLPPKRPADASQYYSELWETMLSSHGRASLAHTFQISKFHPESSLKHGIIASHYDNGDVILHLPLAGRTFDADVTEGANLNKRFDKPGFRISFTTREKSKLTEAHQKSIALAGAAT
ncbi:hypothetical protein BDV26DRAFT_296053 [Aspergillus bertholletiae]|uniref:Uncharacterized protein n=1 Tax=Aspergillus bertholletiae TaxID=1226010 RepID=A0A5N7AZ77_9EURO|nr:hypothetical protein BDV26DRAFT_296053 [Aspergillus bertholletiae]